MVYKNIWYVFISVIYLFNVEFDMFVFYSIKFLFVFLVNYIRLDYIILYISIFVFFNV